MGNGGSAGAVGWAAMRSAGPDVRALSTLERKVIDLGSPNRDLVKGPPLLVIVRKLHT